VSEEVRIDDPAHVQAQYVTEENLETRRSVWHPTADGRDPTTEALDAIVADNPLRVLEVGPGTGMFAVRLAAAPPDASVTTIDQSERFVEMTRARGIDSRVGDAQDLPYADESFDAVAALWMLYHVPDIERALAEVRRVLRPGGLFVAVTNGDGHVAALRREAGGEPVVTRFSSQNGEDQLRRHFGSVERTDLVPQAVFLDSESALAYLRSSDEPVDWRLEPFSEPRAYDGEATIFRCR
jgi:ubiquinone/menaquinone biosynthesis C-methylase UbiE